MASICLSPTRPATALGDRHMISPNHSEINEQAHDKLVRQAKIQICLAESSGAVRLMNSQGPKASSCEQRRLLSDWANAQAGHSRHWVYRSFCWFVIHLNPADSELRQIKFKIPDAFIISELFWKSEFEISKRKRLTKSQILRY